MILLILVWWLLWLQDEVCSGYYLATCECVSAAAEFPCLAPGGTKAGSGFGVLEAVGQPA